MKKITLLMLLVVFLSGCVTYDKGKVSLLYCLNPEGITLENYRVSTLQVSTGGKTQILFTLTNKCRNPLTIKNIKVIDLSAFKDYEVTCGNNKGKSLSITIDPFQSKICSVELYAPEHVETSIPSTIIFSYSFDFENKKTLLVPIIDGITVKRPSSSYREDDENFGYVHIEVSPPIGNIKVENDEVIKEYWGTVNQPFKIEFYLLPRMYKEKVDFNIKEVNVMSAEKSMIQNCEDFSKSIERANRMQLKEKVPFRCEFKYTANVAEVYSRIEIITTYTVTIYKYQAFAISP
ncbi:MAG: hypothetical protein QW641_01885 [Candidatus Aenigmatarchaeota archaeon]